MSQPIAVYGTEWCEDTLETRAHLQEIGVPYRYVDIEHDASADQWVQRQNDGKRKTPTVDLGGLVLSVPSNGELDAALRSRGILSS